VPLARPPRPRSGIGAALATPAGRDRKTRPSKRNLDPVKDSSAGDQAAIGHPRAEDVSAREISHSAEFARVQR
jgi:hypothetical protein